MSRKTSINRRDFVNGCALSLAAGTSISPLEAVAQDLLDPTALPPDYYPPTLQGMRGSHDGSFEVAHTARDGATYNAVDTGDKVDTGDAVNVGYGSQHGRHGRRG